MIWLTLTETANKIAKQSFLEVTTEPEAYGIERPWNSVQEWIDYELDGDGPHQLKREFGVTFEEAANALTRAMKRCATLEQLNTKLPAATPGPQSERQDPA